MFKGPYLLYHTTQQLHSSGCETPELILNSPWQPCNLVSAGLTLNVHFGGMVAHLLRNIQLIQWWRCPIFDTKPGTSVVCSLPYSNHFLWCLYYTYDPQKCIIHNSVLYELISGESYKIIHFCRAYIFCSLMTFRLISWTIGRHPKVVGQCPI